MSGMRSGPLRSRLSDGGVFPTAGRGSDNEDETLHPLRPMRLGLSCGCDLPGHNRGTLRLHSLRQMRPFLSAQLH